MSVLRDFLRNVAPHYTLNVRVVDGNGRADDMEAEQKNRDAEAEALAVEERAAAAAYKADVMKRLAALIAPYKKAVADGGADVKHLQAELMKVKAAIAKHRYTEAEEHLDVLEALVAERADDEPADDEREEWQKAGPVDQDGRRHRGSHSDWCPEEEYEEERDYVDRPHKNRLRYLEDEEDGRPVKRGMGVEIDDLEIDGRHEPRRRDNSDADCYAPPKCPPQPPQCPPDAVTPPVCPPQPVCPPPQPQCPPQTPPSCPPPRSAPRCDPDVKALQEALCRAGFNPGPIDGIMGPKTKAAIKAFQQARGLKVDGIAGPQTRAALGLGGCPQPPSGRPQPQQPTTPGQTGPVTQQQGTQVTQNPSPTAQQTTVQNPQQNQAQNTQVNPRQNSNQSTSTTVNPNQNTSTNTTVNPNQSTSVNPNQSTTNNNNPNQTTTVNPTNTQTNSQQQSNNNSQQVTVNPVTNVTVVCPAAPPATPPAQQPSQPADQDDIAGGLIDTAIGIATRNPVRALEGAGRVIKDLID